MDIIYRGHLCVEDYNRLRASAGWRALHPEQATAGLAGSALVVAACDGELAVGTARLVWDGGAAALIKDVIVLPDYQGKGIGKEPFYEKLGFAARLRENRGAGMDMWLTD